jgi:type II secretory pathway component GspD/PulD (secretin)
MSGNDEAFASNLRYAAPIDFDAPLIVDQTGIVIAPPTPQATVSTLETLGVEFEDYDDGIDVDQRGMVSMSVQHAQLTDVLDSLATASGKDAVVHESVTGTVSADLQDVKFQQALASILHDHGYDFMVEDDLVYVFPTIDWELVTASATGNDYQATAWAVSDAQKRGMGEDFIYEYLHTLGMTDVATYQGVTVFEPTSVPTLAPMTATATPQPIPAPAGRSSAIQPFVDGASPVESEHDIDELRRTASADGYAPFDDE